MHTETEQLSGDRASHLDGRTTDLVVRIAFLGLLAYGSLRLVQPFLPVMIWAVLLTVALFPAYAWLARRLGGLERLAALIITTVAVLIVLGPVSLLAASLAENLQWLAAGLLGGTLQVPPPPVGVATWPIVGAKVHEVWALASTNLEGALTLYGPTMLPAGATIIGQITSIGAGVLTFLAAVLIMGFLFKPGPRLAAGAKAFASRLIAPRGGQFVDLAGATIRNVSRGIIGVALVQTLLAGIILEVADVPGSGLLSFVILILCIIQVGPAPILVPVIIWAWATYPGSAAAALTVALVLVVVVDNVLRPILMGRGLMTPLLVILVGVLGGLLSYGLMGLFLGPVVLAVFYDLVVAWVLLGNRSRPPETLPPSATPTSDAIP